MSSSSRPTKSERQQNLGAMLKTAAGIEEVVSIYKRLHGIPDGTTSRDPDFPPGMLCSQMVSKILIAEYPVDEK